MVNQSKICLKCGLFRKKTVSCSSQDEPSSIIRIQNNSNVSYGLKFLHSVPISVTRVIPLLQKMTVLFGLYMLFTMWHTFTFFFIQVSLECILVEIAFWAVRTPVCSCLVMFVHVPNVCSPDHEAFCTYFTNEPMPFQVLLKKMPEASLLSMKSSATEPTVPLTRCGFYQHAFVVLQWWAQSCGVHLLDLWRWHWVWCRRICTKRRKRFEIEVAGCYTISIFTHPEFRVSSKSKLFWKSWRLFLIFPLHFYLISKVWAGSWMEIDKNERLSCYTSWLVLRYSCKLRMVPI